MIEDELKQKIITAIKDAPTDHKYRLCGLFHSLMNLYKAEEELSINNRKLNVRRVEKIRSYNNVISEIAQGKKEVSTSDLGDVSEFFSEEEAKTIETKTTKPLEGYWMSTFKKIEGLGEYVMPDDEPVLQKLSNIDLEMNETDDNFALTFKFDENDYFTNGALKLNFNMDKDDECQAIESDTIDWKQDKCLTEKKVSKTQTNKKTKKKRTIEKVEKQESFFRVFQNRKAEQEDEEDEEDLGEDEMGGGFYMAEEIGDAFSRFRYFGTKYHAPAFFGVKIEDFSFPDGMGLDGFEGLGDEDEDDDDRDDGDDDEDEGKKKPKKGGKKAIGGAPGQPGQPGQEECKKQ